MAFLDYLHAVAGGRSLSDVGAERAMGLILGGEATTAQIAAFLVALRMKGETSDELLGFARAMRQKVTRVDAGPGLLLDTCGTGGDGRGTFNVSTIAALVAAGAGVRVAKHGNRSISSQCGSADVLEGLGVKITLSADQMGACIRETGIGFLFAPALHPAMRHAQPARLEIKMRTAFNLLGPLTNPAGATAQLVGAPSEHAAELMAEVLARLGLDHGFVVHGSDGIDEITTADATLAFEVEAGAVGRRTLFPEDFGVPTAKPDHLRGGTLEQNVAIARDVLGGKKGPQRDIVLVNAAAALVAAGRAASFQEAMPVAAESLDSGAAGEKLARLAEITQKF